MASSLFHIIYLFLNFIVDTITDILGFLSYWKAQFPHSTMIKMNTPMFFPGTFMSSCFTFKSFIPQACVSGLGTLAKLGGANPMPLWPSLSFRRCPGCAQWSPPQSCSAVSPCRPRIWNAALHRSSPRWSPRWGWSWTNSRSSHLLPWLSWRIAWHCLPRVELGRKGGIQHLFSEHLPGTRHCSRHLGSRTGQGRGRLLLSEH